ncbi:MAG: AEC family transporter [Alphaproteobacteria bacterium]
MIATVLALVPIGLLLAFGYALQRLGLPGTAFWPLLDRVVYLVLLPALLFTSALEADLGQTQALPMALTTVAALVVTTTALVIARRLVTTDGAAMSSVVQGAARVNVYAGFAVAGAVFGDQGVALFALVVALAIPVDNIISVLALHYFAVPVRSSWRTSLRSIALNPLLLSLAAGYAMRGASLTLPGPLLDALQLLAEATLPLALLAVGAGIRFDIAGASRRPLAIAVLTRQVMLPIIALGLCQVAGVGGTERAVVMLHAALPTGPAAYAFARQLGGDAPLMAAIITATTLLAAVSVPFWLALVLP